jgi:chromosome partitioning protein
VPVIAIASPKGGVGKSTTAAVLATTLAEMGASVALADCDRNRPFNSWITRGHVPDVTFMVDWTEDTILDRLEEARQRYAFVVIDIEGAGTLLMSRAIGQASFVVIPLQSSDLDADEVAKALRMIAVEEKSFRRVIPHRVLFTRTAAAESIVPKLERRIKAELANDKVPLFEAEMAQREAFRWMFHHKMPIAKLPAADASREQVEKAWENARAFVTELLAHMNLLTTELAA